MTGTCTIEGCENETDTLLCDSCFVEGQEGLNPNGPTVVED